jgi:hypothetical protein
MRSAFIMPAREESRTKCIFFVSTSPSQSKATIVLTHSSVHAVPHPFIHLDSPVIRTAHIPALPLVTLSSKKPHENSQIDEVSVVHVIRDVLEKVHHLPSEAKPAVFRCNGDSGDVSVPFRP